jgi:hypothetical protein
VQDWKKSAAEKQSRPLPVSLPPPPSPLAIPPYLTLSLSLSLSASFASRVYQLPLSHRIYKRDAVRTPAGQSINTLLMGLNCLFYRTVFKSPQREAEAGRGVWVRPANAGCEREDLRNFTFSMRIGPPFK